MSTEYATRRANRIDRLQARAAAKRTEATSRLAAVERLADQIPLGQPILVGHHSERRARRDAARIHDGMCKGYGLHREAAELERRAAAAASNRAVSSDDPDALDRLRSKLAATRATQARWKTINAALRTRDAEMRKDKLAGLKLTSREASTIQHSACGTGYVLTNLSAEARRLEKRITELETRQTRELPADLEINGVTIRETAERLQVVFPGKPSSETRQALKSAGFRWAPSVTAWQRMPSEQARQAARRIAEDHTNY